MTDTEKKTLVRTDFDDEDVVEMLERWPIRSGGCDECDDDTCSHQAAVRFEIAWNFLERAAPLRTRCKTGDDQLSLLDWADFWYEEDGDVGAALRHALAEVTDEVLGKADTKADA